MNHFSITSQSFHIVMALVFCVQFGLSQSDWLIDNSSYVSEVHEDDQYIVMTNGLVMRKLKLKPNIATIEFKNLISGESFLRTIKPEAELTIDGQRYNVGGLVGLQEQGYLLEDWLLGLQADSNAFFYSSHEVKDIKAKIKWDGKKRYHGAGDQLHPKGKELILHFQQQSKKLDGVKVSIHYEIFDGIPLISKWLEVHNMGAQEIVLNKFSSEILAYPEVENPVESPRRWMLPNIHVESDYAFGGFTTGESNVTTFWETDSSYTSQVNYRMQTPCVLKSKLPVGPNQSIGPGDTFESFHTYELLLDGQDRERNALSKRKMYRLLAPWATENPIFMHLTTTDPVKVKAAIDQCEATGYEMVILSFGSGLNMEDTSRVNIEKYKGLADYAHSKGIELGGYSLFSSRKISDTVDVIDVNTGKPGGAKFGNAPCLASTWGKEYLEKLKYFFKHTGFDLLEHDGPYPGDYCASTSHAHHEGYEDSQWKQWKMTADFYNWLRERDIYLNAPDFYFLQGSSKCGIGYREVNWSLPRDQQIILGRQNIYDGTWDKAPSMAWTFVPLTEYHGGGAAATLEPLKDHLDAYKAHMAQNYGSGVQACYRGPRLYDSKETKALVIDQIDHYKKYRDILNSDLIHLRRATGRTWDGFIHVNPKLKEKGFIMLFNPTSKTISEEINIPMYYTGLSEEATIEDQKGITKSYRLDRNYGVNLNVEIPSKDFVWFVVY